MFTVEGVALELEEYQVVLNPAVDKQLPRIHCPFSYKATEWKTIEGRKQLIYDIFLLYFDESAIPNAKDTLAYLVTGPYFAQYHDTFSNKEWVIARYQLDLWFYDWLDTQRTDGTPFSEWSAEVAKELSDLRLRSSVHWMVKQYLRNLDKYVSLYEVTKETQIDIQRSDPESDRASDYRTL